MTMTATSIDSIAKFMYDKLNLVPGEICLRHKKWTFVQSGSDTEPGVSIAVTIDKVHRVDIIVQVGHKKAFRIKNMEALEKMSPGVWNKLMHHHEQTLRMERVIREKLQPEFNAGIEFLDWS